MRMPSLDELRESLQRYADSAGTFAVDAGNSAVDMATGWDLRWEKWVRDATASANSERAGLQGEQTALGGQFTGGWDPREFVEESFDSMSHEEIVSVVDRMNADAVTASAQGWTAIGDALASALTDFKAAILAEIAPADQRSGWSGIGADSAMVATNTYVAASDQLALAGNLIGSKVAEAATGIVQVKATLPPVEHTSGWERAFNVAVPAAGLFKAVMHERNEAREHAVQVMKSVYAPVMRDADDRVPVLPAPPRVAGDDAPAASAGATSWGATSWGAGSGSAGSGGAASGPLPTGAGGDGVGTADTRGAAGADVAAEPGSGPAAVDSDQASSGTSTSDESAYLVPAQSDPSTVWTRPAGVDGMATTSTAGTPGVSSPAPGVGDQVAARAGAGGSGVGGPGGASAGSLVGATPGAPGAFAPGSVPRTAVGSPSGGVTGTAATGAPSTRPVMAGAGMVPAGARGRDDDVEHATPGYLVTVDNGNDLIGTLPLVAPPVLGA